MEGEVSAPIFSTLLSSVRVFFIENQLQFSKLYCISHSINQCSNLISKKHNDPKFLDRLVWANSADPDQVLHYLQYCLHLLDALLYGKTYFSSLRMITAKFSSV